MVLGSSGLHRSAVNVLFARFTDADRELWLDAAEPWLSEQERSRATGLVDADKRALHVIGRAVLRILASEEVGLAPSSVQIQESPGEKPVLLGIPDLKASVSHTGRLVVVAVCRGVEVGVDVETEQATVFSSRRLATRFFASQEAQELSRLPPEAAAREFTRYWTIKEAVGKALGSGIFPALSGVVVQAGVEGMHLTSVESGPAADRWTIHQFVMPDGIEVVAVALPAPDVTLGTVSALSRESVARGSFRPAGFGSGAASPRT